MQFVSSSTPLDPFFDNISVNFVKPVISATMIAPKYSARDG
jgi:hypothetical protein